ncbi:unnamed protein product, partial [Oppiella nova]
MESGAHMYNKDRDVISKPEALASAQKLAEQLKCNTTEQWIQCLRGVDAKEFLKTEALLTFPVEGTEFLPISEQKAFETKKFNSDIDLMAGMTSDEASGMIRQIFPDVHNLTVEEFKFFVSEINQIYHGLDVENVTHFYFKNIDPKDPGASVRAFEGFLGDLTLKCTTYLFAKQFATNAPSKNVYSYELTFESLFMTNATGCPPG